MDLTTEESFTIIDKVKTRLFYHLPPTAVSIKGSDILSAIQGLTNPKAALKEFASVLAQIIKNQNLFFTDSGRSALMIILLSLKKQSQKTKVILPAYSCPTVAHAILKIGLTPVFCDMDVDKLKLDRNSLLNLIDTHTLAIIPTFLHGLSHDISDLIAIGEDTGIFVIEDAAQAFGACYKGMQVGTIGDFGFFSMGQGKCIPSGHGGIIVCKDKYAADLLQTMKEVVIDHAKPGIPSIARYLAYGLATTPFGWWFIVRSPINPAHSGMDKQKLPAIQPRQFSTTQAGIATSIINRIEHIENLRRQNASVLIEILSKHGFIKLPHNDPEAHSVFLRLPILVENESNAEDLFRLFSKAGIGISKSYTRILPEIFSDQVNNILDEYPGAEYLAKSLFTLPTHHLKQYDISQIESVLDSFQPL